MHGQFQKVSVSQFSSANITKNEMQEQNQDHPVKALYWDIHLC